MPQKPTPGKFVVSRLRPFGLRSMVLSALILSIMGEMAWGDSDPSAVPRFFVASDPESRDLIAKIEAYARNPPLYTFEVDSLSMLPGSDSIQPASRAGWITTWGHHGWGHAARILFRIQDGAVTEHRIDSLADSANDRKLSSLERAMDSCKARLDSIRKAEADSLAEANESFQGLRIGSSDFSDTVEGLGHPLEVERLDDGKFGIVFGEHLPPRTITFIDLQLGRVPAHFKRRRKIQKENCGDSIELSIAIYAPVKKIYEPIAAFPGTPAISRLHIFRAKDSLTCPPLRSVEQDRWHNTTWMDIWHRDTLVAKILGDDYLGANFRNTFDFVFQERTYFGISATPFQVSIFGWLVKTDTGWREIVRHESIGICYD